MAYIPKPILTPEEERNLQLAEDNRNRDYAIKSLIDKAEHAQLCLASIFQSIERINSCLEMLADDNAHLHLPRLTTAPPGKDTHDPKIGIRVVQATKIGHLREDRGDYFGD
jgi:hypothetical protein